MRALLSSFILSLLLCVGSAAAATVTVCSSGCGSSTVQGGIGLASAGDTVVITDSRQYNENLVIGVMGLNLTSNSSSQPLIWSSSASLPTVNISADNVTVSRLSILYNGSGSNFGAVDARNRFNITLTNDTVNNTGQGGSNYGVHLRSTYNSTVARNDISTNGGSDSNHGVFLDTNSSSNLVAGNEIYTNGVSDDYGILLANSFTVTNSNFYNNITQNTIYADGESGNGYGVYVELSPNTTVYMNSIHTNGGPDSSGNWGVYLHISSNSSLVRNNITTGGGDDQNSNTNTGVDVENTTGSTLSWNVISTGGDGDSNEGIYLYESPNATISYNTVSANGTSSNTGIDLEFDSNYARVSYNNVSANGTEDTNDGATLFFVTGTIFRGNNVTTGSPLSYGVDIETSNGTIFYGDTIDARLSSDIILGGTRAGNDNYMVDASFNASDIATRSGGVKTKLFVQHLLDVLVNDGVSPLPGATVYGNDTSSLVDTENPTSNFTASTNSSGYIPQQTLTEFMVNGTYNATAGYLYFTDYNLTASKTGYPSATSSLDITGYFLLTLSEGTPPPAPTISTIFGKGASSFLLGYDTSNPGEVYAIVNSENASHSVPSGWSHVVMTFDSGAISLYVDGQLVGTSTTSATPTASQSSILLGNGTGLNIDEVRFYSRALPASEVEQHYMIGNALKVTLQAIGQGSFGRNLNASVLTTDGGFLQNVYLGSDLAAGTFQSLNVQNVTGALQTLRVTSNSCSSSQADATSTQTSGVYC